MSLTKFFMVAILAFAGFCNSSEAQQTANLSFSTLNQFGALFDMGTVVGTPVTANVPGIPGLTLTAVGAATDTNAVLNASALGLGINSFGADDADGVDQGFQFPIGTGPFSFGESITFTFNQDVAISNVSFADLDAVSVEAVAFNNTQLTGLGLANGFNVPPSTITAGTPVVFSELTGDGATLTGFTVSVPEPGSIAMLGFGSVVLMARRRRR